MIFPFFLKCKILDKVNQHLPMAYTVKKTSFCQNLPRSTFIYLINIFTTQNYLSRKKYIYSRFLFKISIFHSYSISIKI